MATAQQTANLKTAQRIAAGKVGALGPNGELMTLDLSYSNRVSYEKTLAGIILKYPERFAPEEVSIAQGVANSNLPSDLETYTIAEAASDFVDEAGNQALEIGKSVAAVGEGVKNTLNLSTWLIPVAVVVGVVILLFAFARRTGAKA
ncbi:MAG: hypothetical protein WC661_10225 [Opitutaceae bacterium]|jgi:hypothetical protein